MGNKGSHTSFGNNPTLNAKLVESQPGLQIYQNYEGEEFEKYTVPCQHNFQVTYQFRVNNKHPQLVDLLYAGQPHNSFSCNTTPNIIVVSERIPYRLDNLPPQQLLNAVTILKCSLLGFKDLFKVHGIICVRDSMIGISSKNKVKVWLNSNFALNKPQPRPTSLQNLDPALHQRQMVQNLFDLINSKSDPSPTWRQLTHARQTRQILTFDEALNLIDQFIAAHNISISDEVKNPFNKNINQRDDYNSQIDKLEELRNKSPEYQQHKRLEPYQQGSQRRVGGANFHAFKNKIVGGEGKTYQPFNHIQNRGNVEEQINTINRSNSTHKPSAFHIPRSSSPSQQPLQIKFNYQGQTQAQPVRTNPLHMIPSSILSHQIARSSSQQKQPKQRIIQFPNPIKSTHPQIVNNSIYPTHNPEPPKQQKSLNQQNNDTFIYNLQAQKQKSILIHEQKIDIPQVQKQEVSLQQFKQYSPPKEESSSSINQYPSPTFKLPPEARKEEEVVKNHQTSAQKQFEIKVKEPEAPQTQEQFISVEPGTSLKEIVISQPYEQGHNQKFFGARQAHSINTQGSNYNSNQSFSKYADLFPEAKRTTSIKQGSAPSSLKPKKQEIKKLQKIQELNSFIGMSDSQQVNNPPTQAKSPRSNRSKKSKHNQNKTIQDSLSIKQSKKSVLSETKRSGINEAKRSGINETKKSGIFEQQRGVGSQMKKSGMMDSKQKISKVSYKDMRKMLLQTMQNI